MASNRCPKCGFKYGWDGTYCFHCRHGKLTHASWDRFSELVAFPTLDRADARLALFGCACVRRVWHFVSMAVVRDLIVSVEEFAAGNATLSEVEAVAMLVQAEPMSLETMRVDFANGSEAITCRAVRALVEYLAAPDGLRDVNRAVRNLAQRLREAAALSPGSWYHRDNNSPILLAEELAQCDLYRDIVPLNPPAFDPSWRTSAVVGIADAMFDSREFGNMPILADAIEDAGCTEERVIAHCRADKSHVRGCWVIERLRTP